VPSLSFRPFPGPHPVETCIRKQLFPGKIRAVPRPPAEPALDELQLRAWRAFLYAYSRVVPRLDQELRSAHGLSLNQYEVLLWLGRAGDGGLRMSELASRVVLSPSGVTRAVDQLERGGLVARCVFEGDKRGYLATLTTEGRALLRNAAAVHLRGVREHFLNHMSSKELEDLATSLEAVLAGERSPVRP
jgi:DNA-binding MarR family transcriptional regulator